MAGLKTEYIEGKRMTGSTFVVTECDLWEKVWVQIVDNGTVNGGGYRHSVFTGFLLHWY